MEDLKESEASTSNYNRNGYPKRSFESNSRGTVNNFSTETKVCVFFKNYEYCKFGNNCKFLHSDQLSWRERPKKLQNHDTGSRKNCENISKTSFHQKIYDRRFTNQIYANRKRECRYFKAGSCDKGDSCPYQHILCNTKTFEDVTVSNHVKKKRVPICHYFKKGNCQRGTTCKFYHQIGIDELVENSNEVTNNIPHVISDQHSIKNKTNNLTATDPNCPEANANYLTSEISDLKICTEDISSVISDQSSLNISTKEILHLPKPMSLGKKFYNLSSLSSEELLNLRDIEVAQLKKRYPKSILSEENQTISITFEPSDPDWPFDLKSLDLEVHFPDKYPAEACKVSVLSASIIPGILLRYLNQAIHDWICKRYEDVKISKQVELVFRPFLKWFDKSLEELFICGLRKVKRDIEAKESGIEFVPVEALFPSTDELPTNELPEINNEIAIKEDIAKYIPLALPKKEIRETAALRNNNSFDNTALKQGVKVLFTGLELVEGVAALSCTKLFITVHCIRCKTSCDIKCLPGRNISSKCSKCSKVMECAYSSSVLHQFSNVAGNLNAIECRVVDINLVESSFLIDCLSCSKQIPINGLHYGQKQKRWCIFCSEKLIFSIEGVKFQAIVSSCIARKNVPVKKVEKRKDPLIKEGEPLPDFGTCKHYKKSHRWLRFPCCGKLYPCDICHDEKENDHEMKFASRMICGFCSKEQPFSKEKPCFSCSGALIAKAGAHWEGGKGCRNRTKMARDDKHKYLGTCKTTSKKAQTVKVGKKK